MGFIDVIVTPFYILLLFIIAYIYKVENRKNALINKHFLRAYILRIMGGIAFAGVYFFYYGGGDTFTYHKDSLVISEALRNDFSIGIDILFNNNYYKNPEAYFYYTRMDQKTDIPSLFIERISAIINIFTFDSYLSTTIVFSLIGFWGSWKLFLTLCKMFPSITKELSIGCLYLPSIIFWASGIMKDTICTAALCILFSGIIDFFVFNNRKITTILLSVLCFYILIVVKIYVAMCFIPTISIYIFSLYNQRVKSTMLRLLIRPFFYLLAIFIGYAAVNSISTNDEKYNLEKIEGTAKATADYIGRISQNIGGSFYSLGVLDFSASNIPILMVKAFEVTFYRPYIWEIKAPLMVFSMTEGLYFMYLSFLFARNVLFVKKLKNVFIPFTSFCFLFAIFFSFIVGVTSNNFGTLARYKALMLPFFVCGIYVTIKEVNPQEKKLSKLK